MEVVWAVLALLLMAGLGILMVFEPELFWKLEHFFDVKDGAPTDFYITKTRFLGVLWTVISLFAGFVILLNRIF